MMMMMMMMMRPEFPKSFFFPIFLHCFSVDCQVVISTSTWNPNLNAGNAACNAGPSARRAGPRRRGLDSTESPKDPPFMWARMES